MDLVCPSTSGCAECRETSLDPANGWSCCGEALYCNACRADPRYARMRDDAGAGAPVPDSATYFSEEQRAHVTVEALRHLVCSSFDFECFRTHVSMMKRALADADAGVESELWGWTADRYVDTCVRLVRLDEEGARNVFKVVREVSLNLDELWPVVSETEEKGKRTTPFMFQHLGRRSGEKLTAYEKLCVDVHYGRIRRVSFDELDSALKDTAFRADVFAREKGLRYRKQSYPTSPEWV